jgi:hypothetical protein
MDSRVWGAIDLAKQAVAITNGRRINFFFFMFSFLYK